MGWTGTRWTENGSVKEFLEKDCFGDRYETVFHSNKSNVHFFGLKDKENGDVFLVVVAVRFSKSKYYNAEIWYKDMEECEGPYYYANNETLEWLEKNIPVPPNDFAKEWRIESKAQLQKSAQNLRRKRK